MTELEADIAEFDRMEKRIANGETRLFRAKSVDDLFA
jgi:hypothetical protein